MSAESASTRSAILLGVACVACGLLAIVVGNYTGAIEPSLIALLGIAFGIFAWRGGMRWLAALGIMTCLAPVAFWVLFAADLYANGELGF